MDEVGGLRIEKLGGTFWDLGLGWSQQVALGFGSGISSFLPSLAFRFVVRSLLRFRFLDT